MTVPRAFLYIMLISQFSFEYSLARHSDYLRLDDARAVTCAPIRLERGNGWIFYNRIGKASSTTVSKFLLGTSHSASAEHETGTVYHEFIGGVLPGDPRVNEAECWSSSTDCAGRAQGIASRIATAARIASHNRQDCFWEASCNTTITSKRWGLAVPITSLHAFFVNWSSPELMNVALPPKPVMLQVLRNGTDRYVSQYFFLRGLGLATPPEGIVGCIKRGGDFLGCPPFNYQTSYLCGYSERCRRNPVDKKTFERAVRILIEEYAVVGVTDSLPSFAAQVAARLPLVFDAPAVWQWISKYSSRRFNAEPSREKITPEAWRAVADANSFDNELYRVAKALSAVRRLRCRQAAGKMSME